MRQDFTILKPKIAVLGLNPQVNCGQNGDEEVNVIIPAIERAREEGIMAIGPFSAERFFSERMYEKFDAVLAMYYDQGVVAFKSVDEESAACYIAGLPVICSMSLTDPHYDIVGQNLGDEQGLRMLFIWRWMFACIGNKISSYRKTRFHIMTLPQIVMRAI